MSLIGVVYVDFKREFVTEQFGEFGAIKMWQKLLSFFCIPLKIKPKIIFHYLILINSNSIGL